MPLLYIIAIITSLCSWWEPVLCFSLLCSGRSGNRNKMKCYKITNFLLLKLKLVERMEGKRRNLGTQQGLQSEHWIRLGYLAARLCKFLG